MKQDSDHEEYFPGELVAKLINGKNTLLTYREYRGLSQEELSKKSNISIQIIQDIEAGKYNKILNAIEALSDALAIDPDMITSNKSVW